MKQESEEYLESFVFNVRSIINRDKRTRLANYVSLKSVDFFMLTETWLHCSFHDNELFLPNYAIFRSERKADNNTSKHGGVLIAIKNTFVSRQIPLYSNICVGVIACSLCFNSRDILLVCFYAPPISSCPSPYAISPQDRYLLFEEIFTLSKTFYSTIVYGDFNLPEIDWHDYSAKNSDTQKFVDLISFHSFQQIIDFPTAASGILDLILVNPKTEVIYCKKINLDISLLSNHDAIALKVRVRNLSSSYLRETNSKIVYSFCKARFDEMNKQITELPFHGFCWSNINVLLEQWYDWVRPIIFENVPKRTMHRSQLSPWIKPPTSNAIKRLETARRNNANNMKKIAMLEGIAETLIEEDKAEYESNLAASRSTEKLFKYYRNFKATAIPNSVSFKNEIANDPVRQCSLFSKYFASIFKISSSFVPNNSPPLLPLFTDFDISQQTIEKICENLDVHKAKGPDEIPAIVYKRCSRAVSKSLNQIFYKIKQTSVFPGSWKNSVVVPTYKKGCKAEVENYRQVSLLSIASKIFERCLFICLYRHLEPIFHQAQYGFRKGRSCVVQLLVYLEAIYKSIDSKENIDIIYTDYEKAFDNVDHGILLTKLFNLGVRGKVIKLLQSYLI